MPKLCLTPGADDADPYGYKERLAGHGPDELVRLFNSAIGSLGWVTARGHFLAALREALLASGLDCSAVVDSEGMDLSRRVRVQEQVLIPID